MELGQYQMQIFVSLIVILGAAFVALICDLLKGNNEQLRELAIELKVRREEEHKRFQMLAPRVLAEAAAGAPAAALSASPAQPVALAQRETPKEAHQDVPNHQAPKEAAAESPERKNRRPRDPNKRPLSPEALAAIQLGEQLAASPKLRRAPASVPPVTNQPRPAAAATSATPAAEIVTAQVEVLAPVPSARSAPAPAAGARDWGQLLSLRRAAPPAHKEPRKTQEPTGLLDAVMAATNSGASTSAEPALPAGFQDGFVLTRLVENRQPVSGLVVSIGASALSNQDASVPAKVRSLIQSLLGPNDFAAQSGNDEFLLIYPGERGAQAQRKLSQIAEQLWEFQLRSMGALSIQFSWGGVEVRSESIDEAIASATERMQETRRGRKILTMEARPENETLLRRAV